MQELWLYQSQTRRHNYNKKIKTRFEHTRTTNWWHWRPNFRERERESLHRRPYFIHTNREGSDDTVRTAQAY